MWLIDVESRKLIFVVSCREYYGKYAILSHTWEEDEVTFQEFREGIASGKNGHAKITATCDQAQKDGLPYAWVDTCCINKESSAELSEAINSMWKYYKYAEVCYVLLSDVTSEGMVMTDNMLNFHRGEHPSVDEAAQRLWNDHVVKSRWFTRGWTLQELIAPRRLMLFNSTWDALGKRKDLSISLSELTGIDVELLADPESPPLELYTIAKRMSWAAGRRTSYIEDRAYSLLGLFNINMPLLYGEGGKSFIRLQEEIIKRSSDMSFLVYGASRILETMDTIFADSPDRFAKYSNVVPWKQRLDSIEFHITNRGLYFPALHMVQGAQGFLALLNCRFEHDFSGPLALRLWSQHQFEEFHKGPYEKQRKSPPRASNHDYLVHPTTSPWEDLASSERVAVVPNIENAQIREEPATILHGHPPPFYSHALYPATTIWVRVDEYSKMKMKLVDTVPKDAWNLKTGVMLTKYNLSKGTMKDAFGTYVAGVTVEMAGDMSHLVDIGFRFWEKWGSKSLEFKVAGHVLDRDLWNWVREDGNFLEYLWKNTVAGNEDYQRCISHCEPLCEGLELLVELRCKRVLGEEIWVLEVGAYDQNMETDVSYSYTDRTDALS